MVSAEHETQTLNIVNILFFLKNTSKPIEILSPSKMLIFTWYQLIDMYISKFPKPQTNVNVEELKL